MRQQDVDACVLNIFMHEYIYQRHNQSATITDAMLACRNAAIEARGVLTGLKGEENKAVRKRVLTPKRGTIAQGIELLDLYKETFPRFSMPEEPLNPMFQRLLVQAAADGMEVWKRRFELVRKSDFLMGKVSKFQASLNWLVRPENIAKLEAGGYP